MPVYKSGFAAVIGWTNVGKSTLLNRLLEQKMVITSPRPQTTRYATNLVLTEKRGQIVFIDTPGFHQPRHLLSQVMIRESQATLMRSDIALHVISPDVQEDEAAIRHSLERFRGPRILTVNKIDLLGPSKLIAFLNRFKEADLYDDIVPVSAVTGENVAHLLDVCLGRLPEGKIFFPEDELSDRNERFFMGEIIREKVISRTRQELPYATAVVVEQSKWQEGKKLWHIMATIYVEKDSQKSIVIGSGGRKLKEIGTGARLELEVFLQAKVFLELWVKVRRNWTRDPQFLEEIGYARR